MAIERGGESRHRGIGGAAGGLVLLALLAGAGGLMPSALAERLEGLVDGPQVGRVVQAVGEGDVARTTDELAALIGGLAAGAAGLAQEVAGGGGPVPAR